MRLEKGVAPPSVLLACLLLLYPVPVRAIWQLMALLRNSGHDAGSVQDEVLSGAPDPAVWEHVCKEGCILFIFTLSRA